MGLLEQISAKALAPRVTEFTTPEGDRIARMDPVPPSAGSAGDGYEIHRDDLLDILAAATEGEVEMLWNNSITSLHETDEERVHVTFRDGTERDFSMVFGCDGNHSTVRRLHFGQEALYSHFLRTYFSVATLDDLVIEPQTTRITNAPGVTMLVNSYDTTTDLVLGFRSEQEIPFDHHDEAAQKRILREHMLQAGSPFSDHVDEAIGAEASAPRRSTSTSSARSRCQRGRPAASHSSATPVTALPRPPGWAARSPSSAPPHSTTPSGTRTATSSRPSLTTSARSGRSSTRYSTTPSTSVSAATSRNRRPDRCAQQDAARPLTTARAAASAAEVTRHRTNTRRAIVATVLIVGAAAVLFIGLRAAREGHRAFARRPGTLWDPRVVNLTSEVQGELLVVRADYWSRELPP